MIVVDTSALVAILQHEPGAHALKAVLMAEERIVISAGTLAEALIVAVARDRSADMARLIDDLQCEVEPVSQIIARRVAEAYSRWGRGLHRAGLNYGDCFAYEAAERHGCPLLFVGQDFSKTDVQSAL